MSPTKLFRLLGAVVVKQRLQDDLDQRQRRGAGILGVFLWMLKPVLWLVARFRYRMRWMVLA
jgi:hypothetical protein